MLEVRFCLEDLNIVEAGCDEAGRGCLAGPVVAAAVILPNDFRNEMIDDSKKISEKQRDKLRLIIEKEACTWGIGIVSPKEIDEINILQASFLAMHRAIANLKIKPQMLLIDGNRFKPYKGIEHNCIVKGDSKYLSIAAASILAKTYRDEIMKNLHVQNPLYGWNENKGYPTKKHRYAIEKFGSTLHHRMTFNLLKKELQTTLSF